MLLRALLALGLVVTLTGCGDDSSGSGIAHDDGAVVREAPTDVTTPEGPRSLEEDFLVVEGVWWLGTDYPRLTSPSGNRLLWSGGRSGLWISVPGLYGLWPVRLDVRRTEPRVPRWCEDVVEAPYEHHGDELRMGSFETTSDPLPLAAGSYRVRLCATGLDAAATEEEFDGEEYHVYSSRHLIQVWPAPAAPERVLREGSRWARDSRISSTSSR